MKPPPKKYARNCGATKPAVDSELAWLPLVKMDFPLTGPFPNWVYGVTNAALLNPTNGILLVARLDGPTADIANGLVDKAMQAERDGLWGRAYFDARGIGKKRRLLFGRRMDSRRGENFQQSDSKQRLTTSLKLFQRVFP